MFFSKKNRAPVAEKKIKEPIDVAGLKGIESKRDLNVGLPIVHKTLGRGVIKGVELNTVRVDFVGEEPKDLLIDICLENGLLFNENNV